MAPKFVVAFRTHLWTDTIAQNALHLQTMSEGAHFVVLADETSSVIEETTFEKVSHTSDFSTFGLPSFPTDKTLWYNADYPLYYLCAKFPDATHIAMVEYDVAVNIPLLPVFHRAALQNIDLIAHYIVGAEPGWYWTSRVAKHFMKPMQAFLPFVLVSARAISHLLSRRRSIDASNLRTFEDWPFCEAFIPSALTELKHFNTQELKAHAELPHYTLENVLHPQNPSARKPGTIAHPVRVSKNILLGKPANQSSIHPWWNAVSTETDAARGNNGIIGKTTGFNTAPEFNPWWQVDLLADHLVSYVDVHNRVDAPTEVLRVAAHTSEDGCHWQPFGSGAFDQTTTSIRLKPAQPFNARYVRVSRVGYGELHLDEIEAF